MAEQNSATASIRIDVLPDGCVRMSATCQGRFDSLYAPLADGVVPREVEKLLAELRQTLAGVNPL